MFLLFVKPESDHLETLLRSWSETPAPDARLAAPVWQRIEAAGGRAGWADRLVMFVHELDARVIRPRAIAALFVASLLVGVGIAEFRTIYDAHEIDREMSARYLSMLDTSSR